MPKELSYIIKQWKSDQNFQQIVQRINFKLVELTYKNTSYLTI